jgi:hypothetical protein
MRDSYLLTIMHYVHSELVRNFSRWKSLSGRLTSADLTADGLWVGTRLD